MKTKIVLTAFALSLSLAGFSQVKKPLEKRITNYSAKIDSIVSSEKQKMNLELNDIEKKFKEGIISENAMKEERKRISINYSELINAKINAEKEDFEEITKESAQNAILGNNNETNEYKDKKIKKEKHPKDLLKTTGFTFATGFMNVTTENKFINFSTNSEDISFGKSRSGNIAITTERQIGKLTSPVFFSYGLGLRSDSYYLNGDRIYTQYSDELQISPFISGNLKYSRLNVDYLEIPLDFNLVLNPKFIDYEGQKYLDASKRQFRIGLGIYGGVKVGNRIRYKYSNAESSKNIAIQRVENGLNTLEFGTKLSIGYGGFNLFLKKDLTPAFNKDAAVTSKYALQIGIEIINFDF